MSGIADAIALDPSGNIEAVLDWKSDVDPAPQMIEHYKKQLGQYRQYTNAKRAFLVMMTSGKVIEFR